MLPAQHLCAQSLGSTVFCKQAEYVLSTHRNVHCECFTQTICLDLQLTELNLERNKMNTEKVNLENQLEAEQEYILNKLHKQVTILCVHVPNFAIATYSQQGQST